MKKRLVIICALLFFVGFSSFVSHKFYISIYQINYAPEKKMLQITSRIFIDDLNNALEKKYKRKTYIGETNESQEDVAMLKKYISEHFFIKVNGQNKAINFLSKELESNVVICYYNIKDIAKIKTLEVQNTALLELNADQQNIIQTTILGNKQSLLLTNENVKGIIK